VKTEAELKGYTPEAPFMARLSRARFLTTAAADPTKHVLHVELDTPLGHDSVLYSPGDAVGVYCPNVEAEVDGLIGRLDAGDRADHVCWLEKSDRVTDDSKNAVPVSIDLANTPEHVSKAPPNGASSAGSGSASASAVMDSGCAPLTLDRHAVLGPYGHKTSLRQLLV